VPSGCPRPGSVSCAETCHPARPDVDGTRWQTSIALPVSGTDPATVEELWVRNRPVVRPPRRLASVASVQCRSELGPTATPSIQRTQPRSSVELRGVPRTNCPRPCPMVYLGSGRSADRPCWSRVPTAPDRAGQFRPPTRPRDSSSPPSTAPRAPPRGRGMRASHSVPVIGRLVPAWPRAAASVQACPPQPTALRSCRRARAEWPCRPPRPAFRSPGCPRGRHGASP
jgi:hypothetical protein